MDEDSLIRSTMRSIGALESATDELLAQESCSLEELFETDDFLYECDESTLGKTERALVRAPTLMRVPSTSL